MLGAILGSSAYVDGIGIADLDGGTYVRVAVAPGKAVFFRTGPVGGPWKGDGELEPVAGAVGVAEFARSNFKLASDIHRPETVVRDPSAP